MRKALYICLLLFGVASCALENRGDVPAGSVTITPTSPPEKTPTPIATAIPTVPEPPLVTNNYLLSNEVFPNPERGFSSEVDFEDPDYSQYYEDGITLVYATIRLDDYLESELPQKFLDDLDAWFELVRGGGVKTILRFSYNDGPYPFPEPDAEMDQILSHIQQLTPILQKNADVIAWLEAGFVGAWGEWHTSTHGLDDDPQAKKQILSALLSAMPSSRSVLLRYPVDITTNFPTPLSAETAFNGSDQARVGFHNDCFLSSDDDEHTYARDRINTQMEELNYLAQSTRFVPVGGESCAYNPPRSDCETALREMQILHFDEIGDGWYPETLAAWEEQGCYAEMESRLGYRLSLTTATMNEVVAPGGILNLFVELKNSGFSPIKNQRPIYLVLDGVSNFEVLLPVDPRSWAPGETSSFRVQLRIPADVPEGKYDLALWLPDAYPELQDNPQYSIRFANEDVWNADTGYNVIKNIEVDSQASGNVDVTAKEFVVLP